jgi:hypothetical protein
MDSFIMHNEEMRRQNEIRISLFLELSGME